MSADAVVSSLMSQADVVVGCDINPAAWLPAARNLSHFYQVPLATDSGYIGAIADICVTEKITHLIPLTDPEVDVLSLQRERLHALGVVLCAPPVDSVFRCRDKWLLHEFLKNEFSVIPSLELKDWPLWRGSFPLLAKPRCGRSRIGHFRLLNARDADYVVDAVTVPYIVQPLLSGSIFAVDVVRNRLSGKCVSVAREELIRTSNGAGLTVKMAPSSPVNSIAKKICDFLDINGCVNMEFLVSQKEFLLMDVNPRFSAGVAFSKAAGYDMARNHLRCFTGHEIEDDVCYTDLIIAKNFQEINLMI